MSLPMVSYSNEDYKHTVTHIIKECMAKANSKLSELSCAEAKWRTEVGILCRLCAKSDYACISILRGRGKDLNLKPKIRKYIHLEINEEEKLPDQVCPLCLSAIKSWDEYAYYVCNSTSATDKEEEEIKCEDVDINFGTEEKMGNFAMIKSEPKWEGEVTSVCCLCQNSDDNFIIVLPEEGTNSSLQVNIKKYLDIDVQEGSRICCLCVNAVNSWHEFVEKCLFTNEIFQELFNSLETEEHILKRIKYLIEQNKNTQNSLAVKTEDITIKEEEIEKVLEEEDENTKVNTLNDDRNESESKILSATSTPGTGPQKKQKCVEDSSEESESSSEYMDSDESFSDYSSENYITIPVMKLFQCNVCSTKFPSYLSLAAHKMAAHYKRTCQCKICFVVFDTPDRLLNHENKKHKWKFSYSNFKNCPICSEIIPKRELPYHLTLHNTLCVICGEVYLSHEAYKEHMKNHNENILCGVCSKIYVSESNYLIDYKCLVPDDKLDKFKCKRCNKPYKSNLGFKRHIDDVQNLKFVVKCNLCERVLTSKRSYNLHIKRTHSADRPYKCDLCKISVKSKASLRRHINKHNVIHKKCNEYNCSVCQKTFTSKVGLMIHMSYHSEEAGRCLCHVCGVLFKNNITLSFHLINHDKNRPYKFYSSSSVKKLNRKEKIRWEHYFCSVCNEGFTRKVYLIKHIKAAHS